MKTEISRDSYQREKRYSGVYQQQGRMLTDADWNELVEILKARLNEALRDVVGSEQGRIGGTPRHRALRIIDDSGIKIQPGHIYIDGMAASLPDGDAFAFDQQVDFPHPPAPAGDYLLYADVWERSITHLMDQRLLDAGLHGADTCTRKQVLAQIKWCPDSIDPEQSALNPAKGDAGLTLTLLQKTTDPDACDPCAAELNIDTRVGNYLFRVEVHDVQGDADNPTQITLKWSSENGAEQFEALATEDAMPAGFISDKWVYEFFDATTERHQGVHLNSNTWDPARAELVVFNEIAGSSYSVPTIAGSTESTTLLRRWDGYCKIDLTSGDLLEGMDRGVELDTGKAIDSLGYVNIGSTLDMVLNSLSIELDITATSFVAGDFWLADVREAIHSEGSKLLIDQPPQGIRHYYLALASVAAGVLEENPEIDRKYAFPPLTQMTRLFMAGGDGQEIDPGNPLAQPLRVGVANGEWPVSGATVRFEAEGDSGSLNIIDSGLTDAQGIAKCEWTPNDIIDATCRVKATLVDPDDPSDASSDLAPPVYFYANLVSADQVAYAPECQPDTVEATVQHLLLGPDDSRLGTDGYYSVKEVLDALLCELKADHIPYDDPGCDTHTVKSLIADLDSNSDGLLTVKDVLDTLLCKLEAKHVPYDPDLQGSRWDDISEGGDRPDTVQQAIDELAENMESTDIRYEVKACGSGSLPTVRSRLNLPAGTIKIDQVLDKLLCEFKANDLPLDRSASLCAAMAGDGSVLTVQDALNYLCDHTGGTSCTITVGTGGQFEKLEQALEVLAERSEICICLLPGDHAITNAVSMPGKATIRISGCGASASRIYIHERLSLSADEIQLRDVSIIGGEELGSPVERGNLILSGLKNSHVIVENCSFNRAFKGNQSEWLPPVIIEQEVRLDWHNNRMVATRFDEQMSGAVTPGKANLSGEALVVVEEMERVWRLNPDNDAVLYEEKIKAVAESIAELSSTQRNNLFAARDNDGISGLPSETVDIPASTRRLPGTAGVGDRNSADAISTTGNTIASRAMVRVVSPQAEATALFNDIRAITEDNISDLIERIKVINRLVSSVDYALALSSSSVSGSITQNSIAGNIALNFSQQDDRPLRWTSVDSPQRRKTKHLIGGQFVNPEWAVRNELHIQRNNLNEVHTLLAPGMIKIIAQGLREESFPDGLEVSTYESLFISGNVFDGDENSFMSRFINLKDNHFMYQNDKGGIVAYLMGYRGIIAGNQSYWDDNPDYRIEQILNRYLPAEASNFVNIV